MTNTPPIIAAYNLVRTFGEGELETRVLQGIDLTVAPGEFLAIMGKSGAGKSTLLYQLSVLDTPNQGSLTITDIDIATLPERERTAFRLHNLGYIFQNYALMPDLTAEENVMLPLLMRGRTTAAALARARHSLDNVELTGKYHHLPSELSGGEQQRVAIARALSGQPKIVFADEPTANLDTVSGQHVINLLTRLHRDNQQTIVMVTHEREYAMGCDRIVHLEDGHIVHEEQLR